MLLFDVAVDIAPEMEVEFNEWYHTHLPRLMGVEGYDSARRYLALDEGPKYRALYEIYDHMYLKYLLGANKALRHPRTVSEWEEWDERFVPAMRSGATGLYAPFGQSSAPVLHGDFPLVLTRMDAHDDDTPELQKIWQEYWMPRLAEDHDVHHATLLRAHDDPRVRWLETKPPWLFVIEMGSVTAAVDLSRSLMGERGLIEELALGEVKATAYRPIARHWPFVREESEVKFFDEDLDEDEEEELYGKSL
jgi:hypothetical protein